tara:strand:+ start:3774 stop:4523 length:750 start_codon:yes stop_codon:yes gene_type:complete
MSLALILMRVKKFILIIRSPHLLFVFFKYGVLAGSEHHSVLTGNLKTIVDIGANKGQFALACRKWSPDAKIICFEPLQGPTIVLKKIFKNDKSVHFIQAAIGPKIIRTFIHLSAKEDSSSLLPIGPKQTENYPGTCEKGLEEVDVAPLSSFLKPNKIISPALLKLDVQGYEMEALIGCENLMHKFEYIYCECSFIELYLGQKLAHDVIDWLKNNNFTFIDILNISHDSSGRAIQADFLFKRHPTRKKDG